ncbi:pyridoxal phosphate binding [Ascochyta rabiei]|uniref:L-serine ammonia-lyase n=2 Tax=Didymella rabiei TaxID=5454 RepID=A0A163MKI2_DIDRA|nr:pyridoxal phosphate binding [Ascochyta rabiei]
MAPRDSTAATPWRRTPLVHSAKLSKEAGCKIHLKLENLQPSGSFKSRGIGNYLLSHLASLATPADRDKVHFYSSSGGNAGLACVHAAVALGAPATIVVPMSTSEYMVGKIRDAGAVQVVQFGASWYEADAYLQDTVVGDARRRGEVPVYVPPFDAREIWEGNATVVHEVVDELGCEPDVLVCSVGGGGLFCGVVMGRDGVCKGATVLAVETQGADSLALSLREGRLATLPAITSIATSLGARTVAEQAYAYAKGAGVKNVVLTDREAMEGCVRFADDERIMVETACGVCLALCYGGRLKEVLPELTGDSNVVIVVCGGSNITEAMLHSWAESVKQPVAA